MFTMGDASDGSAHPVTLTQAFSLQTTEVTQGQWKAVMGSNPSYFTGDDNLPVERVSWNDVQDFIQKLNKLGQGTYRLPTEAEWEFAARAGSTTAFGCGGNESCVGDVAWFVGNSENKTHPVGQKQPNALGLYDMYGNVWEWVQDGYADYPSSAARDPQGPASASERVNRGGSWGSTTDYLKSAARGHYTPGNQDNYLGFRLVRN
jgi:formylglycine-generating enzyme required for sulfatase activity